MSDEPSLEPIRAFVEPLLAEHQMELVELTCRFHGGQRLIRLLVDCVGGVTLHQCARVNQRISQQLEAANLIEGSYTVEVSSPGLDRPLVSRRDFERAIGEDLRVEAEREPGRITEVMGMLLAVQPEAVVLKTSSGNVTIPLAQLRAGKKRLRW
ncbi:MAG: ribosome maturation factor RimP [Candidatus Omnitrophota bacterium]|nr:ribosome maturation factor RimP [Candidatus Omnitrophota bacterium]